MQFRTLRVVLLALCLSLVGCSPAAPPPPADTNPQRPPAGAEGAGTGTPVRIASIHMVDEKTGWAMSAEGRMLRTTDGG